MNRITEMQRNAMQPNKRVYDQAWVTRWHYL